MPNVEKITKQTENPFVNLYLVGLWLVCFFRRALPYAI